MQGRLNLFAFSSDFSLLTQLKSLFPLRQELVSISTTKSSWAEAVPLPRPLWGPRPCQGLQRRECNRASPPPAHQSRFCKHLMPRVTLPSFPNPQPSTKKRGWVAARGHSSVRTAFEVTPSGVTDAVPIVSLDLCTTVQTTCKAFAEQSSGEGRSTKPEIQKGLQVGGRRPLPMRQTLTRGTWQPCRVSAFACRGSWGCQKHRGQGQRKPKTDLEADRNTHAAFFFF